MYNHQKKRDTRSVIRRMMIHIPYARGMQTNYMNVENAVFMRIWMRKRTMTNREHSQRNPAPSWGGEY